MIDFVLSAHLAERAAERGLTIDIIETILTYPDQVLDDESGETGQKIYQSVVAFPEKGAYLIRVFVNCEKQPNVVRVCFG